MTAQSRKIPRSASEAAFTRGGSARSSHAASSSAVTDFGAPDSASKLAPSSASCVATASAPGGIGLQPSTCALRSCSSSCRAASS